MTVEFDNDDAIKLHQNRPNPFSGETQIYVTVPTPQRVTLEILDIFGKTVKTLIANEAISGTRPYS
jgi:hypothetical protein